MGHFFTNFTFNNCNQMESNQNLGFHCGKGHDLGKFKIVNVFKTRLKYFLYKIIFLLFNFYKVQILQIH